MDEALNRYIAGEIAEDHAAGKFSRREALKRLGLMGFGTMAASTLLAACASDGGGSAPDPLATPSASDPLGTVPGTQVGTDITYPGNGVTLQGVFAQAASPKGAVMVIHEARGISDFIRALVVSLADDGYTALAPDLLSRAGGTAAVAATEAGSTLSGLAGTFVGDMRSTLDELARRAPGSKLGMCGFCFGGSQTWRMVQGGDERLAAAIPCYGTPIDDPDFSASRNAAVLGIYAEDDGRVNATRPAVEAALVRDGVRHELRTFPGVGHGFISLFNRPEVSGHDQALLGYQAILDWFGAELA